MNITFLDNSCIYIILNYNGSTDTISCIESILEQTIYKFFEINTHWQ